MKELLLLIALVIAIVLDLVRICQYVKLKMVYAHKQQIKRELARKVATLVYNFAAINGKFTEKDMAAFEQYAYDNLNDKE